jgi:hypothetical protein
MRVPPVRHLPVTAAAAAVVTTTALVGALASTPVTAATAVGHGPLRAHHVRTTGVDRHATSTSTNWSGYAVTGGRYRSVSASWTQPSVSCTSTNTWSSFWVGLDGDGSSTVEQTGTEADCSGGRAVYSSWYEMYPKFPVSFSNPVVPGDVFFARVTTDGSGSFTLFLQDKTRGWSHTVSARLKHARLASAEVIAEAPSSSGGVLPLSNFGTVSFSGATANASPGSISSGGSFSVTWKHS